MKIGLLSGLIAGVFAISLSAPEQCCAQTYKYHNEMIEHPLEDFKYIKLVDVTPEESKHNLQYGYPGIWIKQKETSQPAIAGNSFVLPFIKNDVVNDTLFVEVNLQFLDPTVSPRHFGGPYIDAIEISVPSGSKLKSIENYGPYNMNMTLIDFNAHKLSIVSSNRTNFFDCNLGRVNWTMVPDQTLADGCDYNINLLGTVINVISIPKRYFDTFKVVNSSRSEIKKYKWLDNQTDRLF